jgi:hypothetical protein
LAALIQFVKFFLNSEISCNSPEKIDRIEIHSRALALNPSPKDSWQPEEEKTAQRSSTKFNLREFIHLLSSR